MIHSVYQLYFQASEVVIATKLVLFHFIDCPLFLLGFITHSASHRLVLDSSSFALFPIKEFWAGLTESYTFHQWGQCRQGKQPVWIDHHSLKARRRQRSSAIKMVSSWSSLSHIQWQYKDLVVGVAPGKTGVDKVRSIWQADLQMSWLSSSSTALPSSCLQSISPSFSSSFPSSFPSAFPSSVPSSQSSSWTKASCHLSGYRNTLNPGSLQTNK